MMLLSDDMVDTLRGVLDGYGDILDELGLTLSDKAFNDLLQLSLYVNNDDNKLEADSVEYYVVAETPLDDYTCTIYPDELGDACDELEEFEKLGAKVQYVIKTTHIDEDLEPTQFRGIWNALIKDTALKDKEFDVWEDE